MNFPPGGPGTIFKKRVERPEEAIQKQLIQLADLYSGQVPELRRLYAVPNGGYRTPAEAGILKAMGVRKGVPDLELPVEVDGYRALHLELKAPGQSVSDEQRDWCEFLISQRRCVQVCESVDAAWLVLCWYLGSSQIWEIPRRMAGSVCRFPDALSINSAEWTVSCGLELIFEGLSYTRLESFVKFSVAAGLIGVTT